MQTPAPKSSSCRSCGSHLAHEVVDFGAMPISNALLRPQDVAAGEMFYPMRILACDACHLVQLAEGLPAVAHFHERYVYFSSFSKSWLAHCEAFADETIARFGLKSGDQVLEVASNDGYLLQFFKARGLDTLGIEPSESVASAARAKGIETKTMFFGLDAARGLIANGKVPKLVIANNVFAHVPDLNDFAAGFACLLQGDAVLTVEVHYVGSLFQNTQFDSFYHEHYAYYSIRAAQNLFSRHGLRLFDAEMLATHGGSIRLYSCRPEERHAQTARLKLALEADDLMFAEAMGRSADFRSRIDRISDDLRGFLVEARRQGKTVAGFGAPAKATTLLNNARITRHLLPFTVDSNPSKQGFLIPGVHVPVLAPSQLDKSRPDYLLLLPWNLRTELLAQYAPLAAKGTRFVVAIPQLEII